MTHLDVLIIAPSAADLYQKLQDDFSAKEPNIWAGLLANAVRTKGFGVSIYDMEIERPTPDKFVEETERLDKNMPIILYCRSGRRSYLSAIKLSENGFKEVYNLEGGILSWIEIGNEVVFTNGIN